MKDIKLKKQYDEFSEEFSELCYRLNKESRDVFYNILGKNIKNKKLLDLACGDGRDLQYYSNLGAVIYGLDSSSDLVKVAKRNNTKFKDNIVLGDFENIKFPKNKFDIVTTKYGVQTSRNIEKIFNEAYRVLKPGGEFIVLTTHPLRQYIERRGKNKNYFITKIVKSVLFNGRIVVKEPTHTLLEYFSPNILKKFDLVVFNEKQDFKSTEQIDGDTYPGFMVMKFKKR